MKIVVLTFLISALALIKAAEVIPDIIPVPDGVKGDGVTTTYWDCCKPACADKNNIAKNVKRPVNSCKIDGITPINIEEHSGCEKEGVAYMCTNESPWVVNKTLAYGFSAVSFNGGAEMSLCCSCLLLKFKGQLTGKSMLVQYTNTGGDLGVNHFDIAMPGGGVGLYTLGCQKQWNASDHGWGDRYGGVHTEAECAELPKALQKGCRFRFEFMEGVPTPNVSFYQVKCPPELLAISGCVFDT